MQSQRFGSDPGQLCPEKDAYRLLLSPLCPWCRRVAISRRILGLKRAIPAIESTGFGEDGFEFISEGLSFHRELRARTIRELYRRQVDWSIGDPTTLPAVIDRDDNIVATESSDLIEDLAVAWSDFHDTDLDLFPEDERKSLLELDVRIDNDIARKISAVRHAGDQDYQDDLLCLIEGLTWADQQLSKYQYIAGDSVRESDIRLFAHLTSLVSSNPDMELCMKAVYGDSDGAINASPLDGDNKEDASVKQNVANACSSPNQSGNGSVDTCAAPTFSATTSAMATSSTPSIRLPKRNLVSLVEPLRCLKPWPYLQRYWAELALTPGWLSESERQSNNLPSARNLEKYVE